MWDTLEDALAQAEKMAALGMMAGGVAHEFNNINATVLGYADLLLRGGGLSDRAQGMLTRIRRAATRARDITEGLLTFAGRRGEGKVPADLAAVARDVIDLFGGQVRSAGVTVEATLDRPAEAVLDQAQIGQVVFNLLVNAIHALRGRPDPRVEVTAGDEGEEVWLRVTDNGCGIPADLLPRVFTSSPPRASTRRPAPSRPPSAAPGWGCRSATASLRATAAGSTWRASRTSAPRSRCACRAGRRVRRRRPCRRPARPPSSCHPRRPDRS